MITQGTDHCRWDYFSFVLQTLVINANNRDSQMTVTQTLKKYGKKVLYEQLNKSKLVHPS